MRFRNFVAVNPSQTHHISTHLIHLYAKHLYALMKHTIWYHKNMVYWYGADLYVFTLLAVPSYAFPALRLCQPVCPGHFVNVPPFYYDYVADGIYFLSHLGMIKWWIPENVIMIKRDEMGFHAIQCSAWINILLN